MRLIRRLFPMPGDLVSRKGRHRGRPALVASGLTDSDRRRNRQHDELSPLLRAWRRNDHQGATLDWSPAAELDRVDNGEPEELLAEAAEREAEELVQHLADIDQAAKDETAAEFKAAWSKDESVEYCAAVVDDACRVVLRELGLSDDEADKLLARHRSAAEPTGGWPIVRDLAGVAA